MKRLLTFGSVLLIMVQSAVSQVTIHMNCAQWEEHPLVKKIGLYQTPLVSKAWLDRDLPKLDELEVRSMRYEMACGKDDLYGQPCVVGSAQRPAYSLAQIDYLLSQVQKYSPVLVISHGYTPTILQSRPTEWSGFMDPPTNFDTWAIINERFAKEWKDKNYDNSYVEVWNEPDLKDGFFTGTVDDYLNIYETAAPAVRKGFADIKVGGPAGAFNWWHQSLVDRAKAKNLPLDFLSGHAYGADYAWQLDGMRSALTSLGRNEAEMLLTEYSPYPAAEYQADGPVERAEAAMTFFNALPGFLDCSDLTYVNWAQYIDPGFFVGDKLGLIDRDSGARKSLFNAFKLYGMMPADRRSLTINSGTIKGMASASDDCVTAVVWNTASSERQLAFTIDNIPFETGTIEVYHIDEEHNSWYETKKGTLEASRSERVEITNQRVELKDVVRNKGVCFIRIVADNAPTLFPQVKLGTIVHTHQWFPKRTNDASYALFDPKTWTLRLSSNKETSGRALVGIEVERLPNFVKVAGVGDGNVQRINANSTMNIRLDYQNKEGQYCYSVLYHGGLYSTVRTTTMPWGTKKKPDTIIQVEDFNNFIINVAEHKPENYSGRILISFEMQNVGAGVKQNFQLSRESSSGINDILPDNPTNDSMDSAVEAIYNVNGQRMSELSHGINIIRMSNGASRKIYKP